MVPAHIIEQLKQVVHQILGETASSMFLGRVDKALDEGAGDMDSLRQACTKIEKMVVLFIGADEAGVIARRFKEVLEKAA